MGITDTPQLLLFCRGLLPQPPCQRCFDVFPPWTDRLAAQWCIGSRSRCNRRNETQDLKRKSLEPPLTYLEQRDLSFHASLPSPSTFGFMPALSLSLSLSLCSFCSAFSLFFFPAGRCKQAARHSLLREVQRA